MITHYLQDQKGSLAATFVLFNHFKYKSINFIKEIKEKFSYERTTFLGENKKI